MFLADPYSWRVIGNTLRIAVWVTLLCLLVGFPTAVALARARGAAQALLLVAVILPLSVGVVVKAFAWQIVLRRDGVLAQGLMALGLADEAPRLLFTETGLVLGAANVFLPFMVLPIYSLLRLVDPRLSEAGATLGATPGYRFRRILLPLTMPGIVSGRSLRVLAVGVHVRHPEPADGRPFPDLGHAHRTLVPADAQRGARLHHGRRAAGAVRGDRGGQRVAGAAHRAPRMMPA